MKAPLQAVAVALAVVASLPLAAGQAQLAVESVEWQDVRFAGAAIGLRSEATLPAGGPAASMALSAADLVVRSDATQASTALTQVQLPGSGSAATDRTAFGAGRLEGTTYPDAQEFLLRPLEAAELPAVLTAPVLEGRLAESGTVTMGHRVAGGPEPPSFTSDGSLLLSLSEGTLVVEGDFVMSLWSWDIEVTSEDGRSASYEAGLRESDSDLAPGAPRQVLRRDREEQVLVEARGARLEIDLRGVPMEAFASGGTAEWTKGAAFRGLSASADERRDGPGRTVASPTEHGVGISLPPRAGDPSPRAAAALELPGDGVALLLLLPVAGLLLGAPGAALPWLRRRHAFLLAEAEAALEEGRYDDAADLAHRLRRSRWFAVDAAAVGAEACLQLGQPDRAQRFLQAAPWRPGAEPMRGLLQARAALQRGEPGLAASLLERSLRAAPDLSAQAMRVPELRALVQGLPHGEGYV